MTAFPDDTSLAAALASGAGDLLLALRRTELTGDDLKKAGDHQSNEYLLERLTAERPDDLVLSEESADSEARLDADRVWIIDPLDGTREFGEPPRVDWAVHVALWEQGHLVAGAVALPASGRVLVSDPGTPVPPAHHGPLRLVVSRTRPPAVTAAVADLLGAELVPMGSAGAKATSILMGESDVYLHGGGQYEWDSAAPVAVCAGAGLHTSRADGSPLTYNQPRPWLPDLLICRPELADTVLAAVVRVGGIDSVSAAAVRILHINKFLFRKGGAEGYMEDLAALQEQAGATVDFWGMDHPDNTHVELAETFPSFVEFDDPPEGMVERTKMVGRMVWSLQAQRGMAAAIERFRPDVAHLHNVYHQLSPSILSPLHKAGVPVVLTLHDYKLVCPTYQLLDQGEVCTACVGGKFWNAPLKRCRNGSLLASATMAVDLSIHTLLRSYRHVDAFICPSRFLAGQMERGRVYPDRMHVIRHFIDLEGVEPKATPGGNAVIAGRLSAEKGIDVAIRAMAHLPEPAHLDIAGDGPVRADLEALAAKEVPGRVTFHGRLAKDQLFDLLRRSSVAVVPSTWYENQPMAVLEALAIGLPVIGSDLGGVPELIEPGHDGLLVTAGDDKALATAMGEVLADPSRAFAMGQNGRRKIESEFPPSLHLERIGGLYRHIGVRGA